MLLIEQVCEKNALYSVCVKCPLCKRGRLCDKLTYIKVKTVVGEFIRDNKVLTSGIVKCPSCGQKFNIYLSR